jgi:hypothetical protein
MMLLSVAGFSIYKEVLVHIRFVVLLRPAKVIIEWYVKYTTYDDLYSIICPNDDNHTTNQQLKMNSITDISDSLQNELGYAFKISD